MEKGLSYSNMNEIHTLYVRDEDNQFTLASSTQILATARHKADQLLGQGPITNQPTLVKSFLMAKLAGMEHEIMCCMFLDNQLRLIRYQEMFSGTVNQSAAYPREIAKAALQLNATAVIMAHNHPSGNTNPSEADIKITTVVRKSLEMLGIRLIDHLIVAGPQAISFAEIGEL